MAAVVTMLLSMLVEPVGPNDESHIDVATAERMQQREDYLHEKMNWLLKEMAWSRNAEQSMLLFMVQHWLFQLVAVNILTACWVVWRSKRLPESCDDQDSSSRKEEDEDDVSKEAINASHDGVRSQIVCINQAMQGLPDMCHVVSGLVGDLLGVCRVLCSRTFMPQMHPDTEMDGIHDGWRVQENTIAYCLFVALHPPPGHSFSLEQHTMQQLPASCPSIHVGLECICSREKLVGDTLCFLHHPDGSLTKDQSSYLLRTLCTRSYLDAEKVACWVQGLVHSAWMLLPQSHHWKLTLLPSSRSCRFQLTGMSKTNICTEIILAVRPSSSGTSCILA